MAPVFRVTVAFVAAFTSSAAAQSITWEARIVAGADRQKIIAQGVRTYSPAKDIMSEDQKGANGETAWSKVLILDDNFALSASGHRAPAQSGFGLVIYKRNEDGFSWEWFERDQGNVFRKLQGPGRLAVTIKKGPGYEEIEALEFLDDITLRYLDDMKKPPGTHTHEILVRKGSVFSFAPPTP